MQIVGQPGSQATFGASKNYSQDDMLGSLNWLYYRRSSIDSAGVQDESVDLVYLDQPFHSKATYSALFSSPKGEQAEAQIEALGTPGIGAMKPNWRLTRAKETRARWVQRKAA